MLWTSKSCHIGQADDGINVARFLSPYGVGDKGFADSFRAVSTYRETWVRLVRGYLAR
jgi:hypothetical protein